MTKAKTLPWRVQTDNDGAFDEIVVGGRGAGPALLHAEMMDRRSCFIDVAGIKLWVYAGKGGARVTAIEDNRTNAQKRRVPLR